MPRDSQDGLEWKDGLFSAVPHWTRELSIPAIENVCRQQLNIPSGDICPPVPNVIAFDDSNNNEIGFEWILMELMPGFPAYKKWRTMSMEQKVAITKCIAEIQAELFCYGNSAFKGIGTLHMSIPGESHVSTTGPLTSYEFFIGNRLKYDVPRGPFRCSYDWLESQLKIIMLEQTTNFEKAEDDDDKEDATEIILLAERLLSLLPKVFLSAEEADTEPTVLWHDDPNLNIILVDEKGEITAIIDWETVSALPIWMTTDVPKFLQSESRLEEPKRDDYSDETPEENEENEENERDLDHLDNEGKDSLYWIHRMDYEATQLREVYKTRLRQLWPDWPLQDSHIKLDFYMAVLRCSAGIFVKLTNIWIDHVERGDVIRLADVKKPNRG
ncbi:hypothetical protein E0Z10_g3993 [Xylaria hypoxylon]|uniref:Aminoglycoside phosphotransferase domain-containing protein n=1 Tax=Xylaria hypoxylon TaxID=37992 RepID=A0A4Z0Z8D0_9PEZI|nr:hypothetical protein E0Z10_g3993 [Xylaria hypoxylon]